MTRKETIKRVDLPEGEAGPWKVEKCVIDKTQQLQGFIQSMQYGRGSIEAGYEYTRLTRNGAVIMSDTPDEMRDHFAPVLQAEWAGSGATCLVSGLGLGMVAASMLELPNVDHVHVLELSEDVVSLVEPTLKERYGDRLTVEVTDVLERKPKPGERYNVIWHDIWDDLNIDNLEEMTKLHRRWARRTDWQGSWGRTWLQDQKRRERRYTGYW